MGDRDLGRRTTDFALRIIRMVGSLPRSPAADVLGKQIFRAGTSIGANYREARRARSKADFAAKVGICVQEADESLYWLELLAESGIVRRPLLANLQQEADELIAIFFCQSQNCSRQQIPRKTIATSLVSFRPLLRSSFFVLQSSFFVLRSSKYSLACSPCLRGMRRLVNGSVSPRLADSTCC